VPEAARVTTIPAAVETIKEGIRSMTNGGPCYVKFADKIISAKESIKIIHEAGGIAVLAHLSAYKNENRFITFEDQEELIKELVNCGLDGLEIYIPDATEEEINFSEKMAKKYNNVTIFTSDLDTNRYESFACCSHH